MWRHIHDVTWHDVHSTGTTLVATRFWMTVFFTTIETLRMTKATTPIVTRTMPPAVSMKPLLLASDGTGPKERKSKLWIFDLLDSKSLYIYIYIYSKKSIVLALTSSQALHLQELRATRAMWHISVLLGPIRHAHHWGDKKWEKNYQI